VFNKSKNKKAFTIIELIVVMAVIGILVLLAMPKLMGHTKEAKFTKLIANTKQLENASERYYMDKNDWPRMSDLPYTAEEITTFAQNIYDTTGKEVTLDTSGNYYDIDYSKLSKYIQVPDSKMDYIIQNPIGNVYALKNLTKDAEIRKPTPLFTATFTNAGATGANGPTQAQLNTAYLGTSIAGIVTSNNGIQLWTVPQTGTYSIETYGAEGGNGQGAIMKGDFPLEQGTQLRILVGQSGAKRVFGSIIVTSGSGGTFVTKLDNSPLIISGGGSYGDADITSSNGTGSPQIGYGLTSQYNGGGLLGTGATNYAGKSFISGGAGGGSSNMAYSAATYNDTRVNDIGGFGGGGSSYSQYNLYFSDHHITYTRSTSGSGGGYTGGISGSGGYSYNSGTNQSNSVGNIGNGKVIITFVN